MRQHQQQSGQLYAPGKPPVDSLKHLLDLLLLLFSVRVETEIEMESLKHESIVTVCGNLSLSFCYQTA